jgi:hypothetical protein
MASYHEQIAQWGQQRQQQQIADRVGQIREEYREACRERDQAIADNDLYTAEDRDSDCQRLVPALSSRREGDGNGGGDIETFIRNVVDVLRQRGAMGIRAVRLVARGLEDLAQSAMSRDQTAVCGIKAGHRSLVMPIICKARATTTTAKRTGESASAKVASRARKVIPISTRASDERSLQRTASEDAEDFA